jgi:hypothetical protein
MDPSSTVAQAHFLGIIWIEAPLPQVMSFIISDADSPPPAPATLHSLS